MARETDFERTLDEFVQDHRTGWSHDDWSRLLATLAERGHDVTDSDQLGLELERRRVLDFLEQAGVAGLGPKRRIAIADRYPRLWDLRRASAADLAALPTIPSAVAEELGARLA
jgi:hypothetical protein